MKHAKIFKKFAMGLASSAFLTSTSALAFEGVVSEATVDAGTDYSPFVDRSYPDQVLFGDLHFHTEISFDAGLVGTSLNIHDAFSCGARRADPL